MSVNFSTSKPKELLAAFDARIQQSDPKGKITTWVKIDGGYYTHKALEWHRKAFFRPSVGGTALTFNIVNPQNTEISAPVYGYYHGHLIETFLNHFDKAFSSGSATALAAAGDSVGPKAA